MILMNKTIIGTMPCPFTGDQVTVKKNKNGKLYFSSRFGPVNIHGDEFQDWIEEHMTPAEQKPEEVQEEKTERANEAIKAAKENAPKKGDWW